MPDWKEEIGAILSEPIQQDFPRCRCCGDILTVKGDCAMCDHEGGMCSPPHVCVLQARVIGDEDNCTPTFEPLIHDHETARRP